MIDDPQNPWTYYFLTHDEAEVYKRLVAEGQTMTYSLITAVPKLRDMEIQMDWNFSDTYGLKYREVRDA